MQHFQRESARGPMKDRRVMVGPPGETLHNLGGKKPRETRTTLLQV